MADAAPTAGYSPDALKLTLEASKTAYDVFQMPDGRAAVHAQSTGAAATDRVAPQTSGVFTVTKTVGVSLLDGGRLYWDRSARSATFRPNGDRDFYLGTVVGDAASADT